MNALVNMLNDPMISIRRAAAKSVAQYGEKAISPLAEKIKDSPNNTIILKQVALSLGMIDSRQRAGMITRDF